MQGTHVTPSGLGNQCSVEFNLAYRWHSATSYKDEKWTEEVYKELFGKPAEEVSMVELLMGLHKYEQYEQPGSATFVPWKNDRDAVLLLLSSTFVPDAVRSAFYLGDGQVWQPQSRYTSNA